jgi:Ni/Co efflux regulator RcnB
MTMKQLFAVLVAAVFAAMSFAAVAQDKKMDKMEKSQKMDKKSSMDKKDGKKKSEKKSKDGKKKSADKMDKK